MPLSPLEYLRHILDEIDYLTARTTGLRKEHFMSDENPQTGFRPQHRDHRRSS
jgi:hypothetical protein